MKQPIGKQNRSPLTIKLAHDQGMPEIVPTGSTVAIVKLPLTEIRLNDILFLNLNGKHQIKRVIYKSKEKLIGSMDGVGGSEEIAPGTVVGKIVSIKRGDKNYNPEDIYLLQSLSYLKEIREVQKIFLKEEIDFIILKGLPLHLVYQKSFPRRLYGDCDFLIKRIDFAKVQALLSKQGYTKIDVSTPMSSLVAKGKDIEVSFKKLINGVPVVLDIHLEAVFLTTQLEEINKMYGQEKLDDFSKELFRHVRKVSIQEDWFPILTSEYLFIYLCLHIFHHNFKGAYRYELIDKLLRSDDINYRLVAIIIEKYKLQGFIYPTLFLLEKYYHSPFQKFFLLEVNASWKAKSFFKKSILNVNIFEEDSRINAGIDRIRLIFFLSQSSLWRKLIIFLHPKILHILLWSVVKTVIKY